VVPPVLFLGRPGRFRACEGVTRSVSGTPAGWLDNPGYEQVSSGATCHADIGGRSRDLESAQSATARCSIFFSVAARPDAGRPQGPTRGRSTVRRCSSAGPGRSGCPRILGHLMPCTRSAGRSSTKSKRRKFWRPRHFPGLSEHIPTRPKSRSNDMPKVRRPCRCLFPANCWPRRAGAGDQDGGGELKRARTEYVRNGLPSFGPVAICVPAGRPRQSAPSCPARLLTGCVAPT